MEEIFFPISPAASVALTATADDDDDFLPPPLPPRPSSLQPAPATPASSRRSLTSPTPSMSNSRKTEARIRALTERLNFLDPELSAAASRIDVLEWMAHGGTERISRLEEQVATLAKNRRETLRDPAETKDHTPKEPFLLPPLLNLRRLEEKVKFLSERQKFLDPELSAASSRIEVLEWMAHGAVEKMESVQRRISELTTLEKRLESMWRMEERRQEEAMERTTTVYEKLETKVEELVERRLKEEREVHISRESAELNDLREQMRNFSERTSGREGRLQSEAVAIEMKRMGEDYIKTGRAVETVEKEMRDLRLKVEAQEEELRRLGERLERRVVAQSDDASGKSNTLDDTRPKKKKKEKESRREFKPSSSLSWPSLLFLLKGPSVVIRTSTENVPPAILQRSPFLPRRSASASVCGGLKLLNELFPQRSRARWLASPCLPAPARRESGHCVLVWRSWGLGGTQDGSGKNVAGSKGRQGGGRGEGDDIDDDGGDDDDSLISRGKSSSIEAEEKDEEGDGGDGGDDVKSPAAMGAERRARRATPPHVDLYYRTFFPAGERARKSRRKRKISSLPDLQRLRRALRQRVAQPGTRNSSS